ncbi:hypothetical protein DS2_02600 [Catenovulum agarivorans DS-2]|uniref:Uncharacterized protein n=1 Tax=Catenovulum agarivorans DS-2 TaxID=1328313 RepID=W7QFJ4_9ALTE|nr:EboA domain-containing protein [Catenovulum agarivorans]EWH11679.1 hypothetical protein DS2_02600 [Catenovulum agarivorans DS-2]
MQSQKIIQLQQWVEQHLTQAQIDWLLSAKQSLVESDPEKQLDELLNISAGVKRSVPDQSLEGADQAFAHFDFAETIRLLLLVQVAKTCPDIAYLVKSYYQFGDQSEKTALLKGLNFIDPNGQAVQTAIKASRCNTTVEFSALALRNPYPAEFFPELNFNQLVLKALFMGLEIDQVVALDARQNAELSNMCFAYVIEQALADRTPPASIWLAIQLNNLHDHHLGELERYTQHFYQMSVEHKQQITQLLGKQNAELLEQIKG